MATKVYVTESFELQDGTEVEIKPLNIKRLRKFMEIVAKLEETEKEVDAIDILFDATALVIERSNPKLAEDRETLEDILDVPTMYRILEVAGGVKLGDPNLLTA